VEKADAFAHTRPFERPPSQHGEVLREEFVPASWLSVKALGEAADVSRQSYE
jgi:plasmid maintenance system antidote protein VapI